MTDIDFAELQRQLEERAAANWDPEEAALLAKTEPRRPAASAEIDLEALQREAVERAAAFWDPNEVPLMEDNPAPVPFAEAWLDAVEFAAHEFEHHDQRVTPHFDSSYDDYLKTEHWIALRRRMLARAGRLCNRCRKTSLRLEVHHIDYRHLGAERESDLIVLCHACHELEHGRTWE